MSDQITTLKDPPPAPPERIAFSNAVRLSFAQWLGIALVAIVFAVVTPRLWTTMEPLALAPDHRVPRELFDDYWYYERYVGLAAAEHDVLVLGDSVVWGEWVNRHETLAHYLNAQDGKARFANVGLNGAHPLALEGLVENYAQAIVGKNVLLQCNPLWLTSRKADLQDADAEINHARLVPQFVPNIVANKEEISPRLGVLVERRLAISKWANHLQQAYYRTDGPNDIPGWTLKHPYANPLEPLSRPLPAPDNKRREDSGPWKKRGITPVDFAWIELDTSLQWAAFQRTVEILQRRGNRVFVVVGPFNEHMLTAASYQRYETVIGGMTAWLKAKQIPHLAAPVLGGDLYADASHPLAAGYEILAWRLRDEHTFRIFLGRREPEHAQSGIGRRRDAAQ